MTTNGCPCEVCCDELAITNAPELPTLAYRVGDFSGFRRALLRPLEGESALFGWHPAPGDLGLQVLEWWAYLADVLTFYNERVANEDYLRTAELPASVTNLVALLGYTPRPAIAAAGRVAAIRGTSRPDEPLVVPAGLQLANSATPGVPVQTFEAAEAMFSGRSSAAIVLRPTPGLLSPPASGQRGIGSVLLEGSVAGIAPGEELIALARDATSAEESWTQVTALSVTRATDPSGATNTRVALDADDAGWMTDANAAEARLVRITRESALWTATGDAAVVSEGSRVSIRLASVERSISSGDVAFLDVGGQLVSLKVTGTSDEFLSVPYPGATGSPPSPPPIPVLHTVVAGETPAASGLDPSAVVALRLGLRDVGTPIGSPATTLDHLPVAVTGDVDLRAGGADAFVEGATGAGIPVRATAGSDGTVSLSATDETASEFSLASPLQLLFDLVDVSRGTTVSAEVLGTGDAGVAGQAFTLKRSPLTYLASGAGWKSTLTIAVGANVWTEVATFYDQPPDARVFVVSQLPDGKTRVRFGDGANGARVPTGASVVATYRYGAGAASPPAGRLTTILQPQTNLASVHNPVAVWGGSDAQQPADVRTNAPASVLTFGRAISADDYETVAALAPGVARARAYWTWDAPRQRAVVKVYVGDDAAAAIAARSALAGAEDPNRPVVVDQATPIAVSVTCTHEVSPEWVAADVVSAAEDGLSSLFAPPSMGIGRPLYTSELDAALSVPGVEGVLGLSALADGTEIFSSEPVGWAHPGEGGFYVLSASTITPVVADG